MKTVNKIIGTVFILGWLGVIFYFSASDSSMSTNQTFMAIDTLKYLADKYPFFELVISKLTENHSLVYSIRKLAHLTIFCILQMIIFWTMKLNKCSTLKASIFSILGVILYATFDEIHQYFTPGRSAQVKDVFIDTIGGTAGLCVSYFMILIKITYKRIFNKS